MTRRFRPNGHPVFKSARVNHRAVGGESAQSGRDGTLSERPALASILGPWAFTLSLDQVTGYVMVSRPNMAATGPQLPAPVRRLRAREVLRPSIAP